MARSVLTRRRLLAGAAVGAGAFALGYAGVRYQSARALRWPGQLRELAPPAAAGARLPRLVAHPEGGCVLSWVEQSGGGHVLKWARYDGRRWSAPTEVARGERWFINWIDFPSVAPIDREFWLAHWLELRAGGGRYDYDIALALSRDGGLTWNMGKKPLSADAAAEYGFVSIFPDGEAAGIVWLDGRDYVKPSERHLHPHKSGNFALRATRVSRDGRVEDDRVLDGNVCTCCQTAAAVADGATLVAYRGRTDSEVRDIQLVRKAGRDWSAPLPLGGEGWTIAACPTNGPALAARGVHVLAAWFTAAQDRPRVRAALSADGGAAFGAALDLDAAAPIGRLSAHWLHDELAAVSWIAAPSAPGERAPLRVALLDRTGRRCGGGEAAQVVPGRDSGIPQIGSAGERLIVAFTEAAPNYGLRAIELAVRV